MVTWARASTSFDLWTTRPEEGPSLPMSENHVTPGKLWDFPCDDCSCFSLLGNKGGEMGWGPGRSSIANCFPFPIFTEARLQLGTVVFQVLLGGSQQLPARSGVSQQLRQGS